jgi:archaellum component FlaG (FlaF/FlaG flagellin family)
VLADTFSEAIEKIVKYLNEQGNEVSDEVIQNIQVISEPIDVS